MWGLTQQLDELRKENEFLRHERDYVIAKNKRLRTAIDEAMGALDSAYESRDSGVCVKMFGKWMRCTKAADELKTLTAELTEKIP